MILHDLGRRSEYQATLEKLIEQWGDGYPRFVARVYAWTGQKDEAFEWLGRGPEKYFDVLVGNPFFRSVQGDPRWEELLEPYGLDAETRSDLQIELPSP